MNNKTREIKFRVRAEDNKILGYEKWYVGALHNEEEHTGWEWEANPQWMYSPNGVHWHPSSDILIRTIRFKDAFTGLRDKNGLQEVYEGDIIDSNGNIKGNIYEMDKGEADFVIEGLGTSAWSETEKGGLERGLKYAQ